MKTVSYVTYPTSPIGILDEHPAWSSRLMDELEQRRLPFEKIDPSTHAFDPRDRIPRYSVIVNRTSPSSHTRGHSQVLFYAEPLLEYFAGLGIPVINPVAAWRFEKSKALQADLFERLGVPYPRTVVVNHRDQAAKAVERLRFPVLLKPNAPAGIPGAAGGRDRSNRDPRWRVSLRDPHRAGDGALQPVPR